MSLGCFGPETRVGYGSRELCQTPVKYSRNVVTSLMPNKRRAGNDGPHS
jgi:hypothetical protein